MNPFEKEAHAALIEQMLNRISRLERELRDKNQAIMALVAAAGGEVVVPPWVVARVPRMVLWVEKHQETGETVFTTTPSDTPKEEK